MIGLYYNFDRALHTEKYKTWEIKWVFLGNPEFYTKNYIKFSIILNYFFGILLIVSGFIMMVFTFGLLR